jgi:NCAIR mutase (PurE)-related protein
MQLPLLHLLDRVSRGELAPDEAARLIGDAASSGSQPATPTTEVTPAARIDLDRLRRCGFPEVVYGPGKTSTAIVDIFRAQRRHGQACLATRITPDQAAEVCAELPEVVHNPTARTLRIGSCDRSTSGPARVAIITAGTGDRPVAEEAAETARWMGCDVELIYDVGVAGPHRLPDQLPRFAPAHAIVVVAGMEAALPSVVAGYVAVPVIGVPTSVGYGAHLNGFAAVLTMLNCCAAHVAVVNIDAGFKGGFLAGLIALRQEPVALL